MQNPQTPLGCSISLDFSLDKPCLACPICGDNNIHPTGIVCRPPGGNGLGMLRVDAEGIHLDPTTPPHGRGVNIALEFHCEQGHAFTHELQFHKGQTYVTTLGSLVEDGSAALDIWRD